VKWYRKGADQGDAAAQANLGFVYSNGVGVPRNYAEGVKWYKEAADQGDATAMGNLGFMYLNGLGVPRDFVLAHMWSNLAVSRHPTSEQERQESTKRNRDVGARNRDLAADRMTPSQIAEAQKLAREWKPKKER
jgi:TPR repeat protein